MFAGKAVLFGPVAFGRRSDDGVRRIFTVCDAALHRVGIVGAGLAAYDLRETSRVFGRRSAEIKTVRVSGRADRSAMEVEYRATFIEYIIFINFFRKSNENGRDGGVS